MSPEEYIAFADDIEAQIVVLRQRIVEAYNQVDTTIPDDVRPATPDDIVPGRVVWYAKGDFGPHWHEVFEVRHPGDMFKAYVDVDGTRYGMVGALVRDVKPAPALPSP